MFVSILTVCGALVVADRILIVDDDAGLLALISEDLQKQGLSCACARSDREAYRLLGAQAFDAVVVDVNLGFGTTGFDVARRARQVAPEIRVVYMSGDANAPRSWMSFGVPSSDYVSKPFPLDRLADLLRHDLDVGDPETGGV